MGPCSSWFCRVQDTTFSRRAHDVSGEKLCNEQDFYQHSYHFCHWLLLNIYLSFLHFSGKAREKDMTG